MKYLSKFTTVITLICMITLSLFPTTIVSAKTNFPKITANDFFKDADSIKKTGAGILYTYNTLGSTILETHENGFIKYDINENEKHDILSIDDSGNLYLDGEIIEITYEIDDDLDVPQTRAGGLTYSYGSGPLYGKASEYTYLKSNKGIANIKLAKEIGKISLTALTVILKSVYPPAGAVAAVAKTVYSVFAAIPTKNLSCRTKIYTHKKYTTGNTPTGYCEKQVVTWYSKENYSGRNTSTTVFKNGRLY